MLDSQGELCASCKDEPATEIDHDHSTGKVRGILCRGCNLGLGQFKDDAKRLLLAVEYLTKGEDHV